MMKLTAADGHRFGTFEAGNLNAPRGLVVIQEIFGVTNHMRKVSERLAGYGYRVLCPALYDRVEPGVQLDYTPEGAQRGRAMRAAIPEDAMLADLAACAHAFGGKPVGVIGFCMGGTLAWLGATKMHDFKAAVGWYGGGIAATKGAALNCPVQLHFGGADKNIPLSDVEAIRQAQPEIDVFVYDGAEHGFGCADRPCYSAKDNELAELRSMAFFAERLR